MANFTPSKKTAQDFNGGVEYVSQDVENHIQGDTIQAETINNVIESQLWTQALGTNAPDNDEANIVGAPQVQIVTGADGTPHFKFSQLKGNKGDSGIGVATSSMFWLYVDDSGDLYVKYNEGSTPPQFRLDENKNLYYII